MSRFTINIKLGLEWVEDDHCLMHREKKMSNVHTFFQLTKEIACTILQNFNSNGMHLFG